MKALAVVFAALLALSGAHVPVRLAGYPVAVPVPVLALAAELTACGLLAWLITRTARRWPYTAVYPWRTP